MVGHLETQTGYRYDEVISSLQKCIRRGDEENAMYWAVELVEKFPSHVWNRLEIISHEDIGLGDMTVVMFVKTCKEQWIALKKLNNKSRNMILANAVAAMCRAKKTRLGDHLGIISFRRHPDKYRQPVPDVGHDKHTAAGRRMGRSFDHFFEEGAKLIPSPYQDDFAHDPYEDRARDHLAKKYPRITEVDMSNAPSLFDTVDVL
jgi:replication-associated recombination protein RarA